ncbi:hypothetical protein ACFVXE_09910 [Streptomyces sp. NPDC058231]|uniref:hypothetical protein n=1 Tax=Streptomyces sp. NPDC058231 TaxID=3346392 RepID=UPI0036ECEBF9
MTPNDTLALLVLATAVRVFAPDLRYLTRRLLRAGVRVGAAALVEDRRSGALRVEPGSAAVQNEEAQP